MFCAIGIERKNVLGLFIPGVFFAACYQRTLGTFSTQRASGSVLVSQDQTNEPTGGDSGTGYSRAGCMLRDAWVLCNMHHFFSIGRVFLSSSHFPHLI